jgi:hypothetical protein
MFHETQDIDFVDPFVCPDFELLLYTYLLLGADEVTAIRE